MSKRNMRDLDNETNFRIGDRIILVSRGHLSGYHGRIEEMRHNWLWDYAIVLDGPGYLYELVDRHEIIPEPSGPSLWSILGGALAALREHVSYER